MALTLFRLLPLMLLTFCYTFFSLRADPSRLFRAIEQLLLEPLSMSLE